MNELLEQVKFEADKAISDAWAEGYKAGVLAYAPECEALRIENEKLKAERKRNIISNILISSGIAITGLSIGYFTGVGK